MITLLYAMFGRGWITEIVLTGMIDFMIQGLLLFLIISDL